VTVHDPEWTRDDRMSALGWKAEDDAICSGCGNPVYETIPQDGPEFTARTVRCRGCEAGGAAASAMAGQDTPDPMNGIRVITERER
jgi:hypothetical protein